MKINQDKFLQDIKSEIKDFSNLDLSNLTIENVDLYGCNFKNSSFKNSKLLQCYFVGSDLSNCNFTDADLEDVVFEYSNLTNANFEDTYLTDTIISHSILSSSNWHNSTSIASYFKHNDFVDANFDLAKFEAAYFNNNDLLRVDLSRSILQCIEGKGANLVLTNSVDYPEDLKLLETLKKEGFINWYDGSGNKVSYFLWVISDRQEITIKNILEWGKYPQDTLWNSSNFAEHYYHSSFVNRDSEFNNIKPFEDNLTDIMVYVLGIARLKKVHSTSPEIHEACYGADIYVIGKTPLGNFAGCATEVSWS